METDFRMISLTRSSVYHDAEGIGSGSGSASSSAQQSGTLPRAITSNSPIATLAAGLLNTVAAGS